MEHFCRNPQLHPLQDQTRRYLSGNVFHSKYEGRWGPSRSFFCEGNTSEFIATLGTICASLESTPGSDGATSDTVVNSVMSLITIPAELPCPRRASRQTVYVLVKGGNYTAPKGVSQTLPLKTTFKRSKGGLYHNHRVQINQRETPHRLNRTIAPCWQKLFDEVNGARGDSVTGYPKNWSSAETQMD